MNRHSVVTNSLLIDTSGLYEWLYGGLLETGMGRLPIPLKPASGAIFAISAGTEVKLTGWFWGLVGPVGFEPTTNGLGAEPRGQGRSAE